MRIELIVLVRADGSGDGAPEGGFAFTADASPDESRPDFVEIRVTAHSPEAIALFERLDRDGVEYYIHEERRFSVKEIRTALALHVEPLTPDETIDIEAPRYDWNGCCTRCMRVPEATGTLRFRRPPAANVFWFRGRRGEIIVHEKIAVRMIKEKITGCILREVRDDSDDRPSPYFQVIPTNVLPNVVSPPTRFALTEDACPQCGRGGLFLQSMLYYDMPLKSLADVNVTHELFGEGPALAPEVVVSPRFYNLLVAAGAKLAAHEPVVFV